MPGTGPAGPVSVIATVDAVTGSLNVAVTVVDVAIPTAFGAGVRPVTVGGVVSLAERRVNSRKDPAAAITEQEEEDQ